MTIQEVQQDRRKSPFYSRQEKLDKLNQWHEWKGYSSAKAFYSSEMEYFAVRNTAGVFDLTPMTKYRITGSDSLDYIDRLVTRDMRKIKPGRVAYAVWCDDQGQVIDDGTIFHLKQGEYRLCAQERHMEWFTAAAIGLDVNIKEETADIAALAIQGPTSYSILKNLNLDGIENLKLFDLINFDFQGTNLMISRTGYTGDLGYELWLDTSKAEVFWDALFEAGKDYGIMAMGTEALELARIEAGYLAAYEDFLPAPATVRAGRSRSPFELGLSWLVDLNKPNFNGRRALAKEKRLGSTWRLVKLDIEGNKPANHSYIYTKKYGKLKQIGFVTSAAWSPIIKHNIAIGTVRRPYGKVGDKLWIDIYYQREMHWSRMMAKAEIVDKPFWDPERRRVTPPGIY